MFRSLHMKLVLVLVLLVVSVMAVVGTFLINSVTGYNIEDFKDQMSLVFTQEFILTLNKAADGENGENSIRKMLEVYSGSLGINKYRSFYILEGKTGKYLAGSDDSLAEGLTITPNILTAMSGAVGQEVQRLSHYFDVAIPVNSGDNFYVVGVMDDKTELNDLTWALLTILIQALLFGLLVAILLSFMLSKTITTPVERLTAQAAKIASGDFGGRPEVYSTDEIGVLTQTFNEMAQVMEATIAEVEGERNKLGTLFQHMADGVVAFDGKGKILQKNPAAERMLGKVLEEELTYTDVFPNMHTDEEDLVENGKYIEIDYSANKRILKIYMAPFIIGEDEKGIMAVINDITEQQRLDKSRREFVANVSHELRTPLTNVKGYTETLLEAGEDIDAETRQNFLSIVHGEADRMTHIVKDLLTLSQLDYNRMQMDISRVSLRQIAVTAMKASEIEAGKQGVSLLDRLPNVMPDITADRERVEQVVVNIISNAVKYNRQGGSVTLWGGDDTQNVFIKVQDTGIGVPAEDLPRIFERFYRVDKARSREKGGTGLGLAIAKEIVENLGGSIDIESTVNVGSTVTLTMPMHREGTENE